MKRDIKWLFKNGLKDLDMKNLLKIYGDCNNLGCLEHDLIQ